MSEWSVLITVDQAESQPPIDEQQKERLLAALGGSDSWVQYPPASGRGHGFETRWWQEGVDAVSVGHEATERFEAALSDIGLEARIVLIHVTSPEERLTEQAIGLGRRTGDPARQGVWSVMLRAVAAARSKRSFTRATLEHMLAALPSGDASGFARDGLVELRFWIDGDDAVDATQRGTTLLRGALATLDRSDWTIVRAHTTSVSEAQRTAYLGVEERVRDHPPAGFPIVIRGAG